MRVDRCERDVRVRAVRAPSSLFASSSTGCWTGGVAGLASSLEPNQEIARQIQFILGRELAKILGFQTVSARPEPGLRLPCGPAFRSPVPLSSRVALSLYLSRADGWATAATLRQVPRSPSSGPLPATTAHHQVLPPLLFRSCTAKPSTHTLT